MFAILTNMSSRIFIALLKKNERVKRNLDTKTRRGEGGVGVMVGISGM